MELRQFVLQNMLTTSPTAIPESSENTAHLVWLEKKIASHRFLRSVMIYCFLFSITLSNFEFESFIPNLIVHSFLTAFSVGGIVCIWGVYHAEAVFRGIPHPSSTTRGEGSSGGTRYNKSFSVFHSPGIFWMWVEMVIWLLHPLPGLHGRWEQQLNAAIILRVYVLLLYPSERYSANLFSRAVGVVLRSPPRFKWTISRSLRTEWWLWIPITGIIFFCLAALYRRVEDTNLLNACYFCVSTAAFVGFGNVAPQTATGQVVAAMVWCLGLFFVSWIIRMWADFLSLSEPTQALYGIMKLHRLSLSLPDQAARTIQQAWRLYIAKARKASWILVQCRTTLLARQCIHLRYVRKEIYQQNRDKFANVSIKRQHDAEEEAVENSTKERGIENDNAVTSLLKRLDDIEETMDHLISHLRSVVGKENVH